MKDPIILNIAGGAGKNIIASSVVGSIKKAYPDRPIYISSPHQSVWQNNPDIVEVFNYLEKKDFYAELIVKYPNSLAFFLEPYASEDYFLRRKSLAEIWCDLCKVSFTDEQPKLFFTEDELEATRRLLKVGEKPIFMIQTNGGGQGQAFPISWARDLPLPVAEEVCLAMKTKGYEVFQLRRPDQPALANATMLNLPFRQAMAAIQFSDKRLFIDSFAQHAAQAFGLKSVITWVSNPPEVFGYKNNINIISDVKPLPRHTPEAFLEEYNITGTLEESPYDTDILFDSKKIIEAILGTDA